MTDIIDIDFRKPEQTKGLYVFQCGGGGVNEYCGSETFYILETYYECTECSKKHTFEDVHGKIE